MEMIYLVVVLQLQWEGIAPLPAQERETKQVDLESLRSVHQGDVSARWSGPGYDCGDDN